jgi:hypothetical protein
MPDADSPSPLAHLETRERSLVKQTDRLRFHSILGVQSCFGFALLLRQMHEPETTASSNFATSPSVILNEVEDLSIRERATIRLSIDAVGCRQGIERPRCGLALHKLESDSLRCLLTDMDCELIGQSAVQHRSPVVPERCFERNESPRIAG